MEVDIGYNKIQMISVSRLMHKIIEIIIIIIIIIKHLYKFRIAP